MTAKTIKYSQRLGDVLRCLPAAKHLADKGHKVFVDCFAEYHGVFEMTSYAKAGHGQGDIFDLEIWPNRYKAFIESKKSWHDFIYSHPEIKEAERTNIILDKLDLERIKEMPEKYNLVAPFGISQTSKHNPLEIIVDARKQMGEKDFYVLCPAGFGITGLDCFTAKTIKDMARVIRDADKFWTINSSPVVLAAATRKGKETLYYREKPPHDVQNIWQFDGLIMAN